MLVDSGTSLKRAETESKNKVSSTVNRYVFCFPIERFVGLFSVRGFLRTVLTFLFSADSPSPGLFTVPLVRITDLLSRLKLLNYISLFPCLL